MNNNSSNDDNQLENVERLTAEIRAACVKAYQQGLETHQIFGTLIGCMYGLSLECGDSLMRASNLIHALADNLRELHYEKSEKGASDG